MEEQQRNVWRTNNVETRDVCCFLLSKKLHCTYMSEFHKYHFSKVWMPITFLLKSLFSRPYIIQFQIYGDLNETPLSDCWILPMFSGWKANVGHCVYSWFLLYLKQNVWRISNVETMNTFCFPLSKQYAKNIPVVVLKIFWNGQVVRLNHTGPWKFYTKYQLCTKWPTFGFQALKMGNIQQSENRASLRPPYLWTWRM